MKTNHTPAQTNWPVNPTGEMSNLLIEDFEAVLNVMNTEAKKGRFKL